MATSTRTSVQPAERNETTTYSLTLKGDVLAVLELGCLGSLADQVVLERVVVRVAVSDLVEDALRRVVEPPRSAVCVEAH